MPDEAIMPYFEKKCGAYEAYQVQTFQSYYFVL